MDYNKLTTNVISDKMRVATDISNLVLCFGLLVSYQYIISNLCLQVLHFFFDLPCGGATKAIQIAIAAVCIQIPLSCLKNISQLQYISILGTISLALSILVIVVESPFYFMENSSSFKLYPDNIGLGWIDTTGIFLFGFSSHNGIFQIFRELKRPGLRRCKKVLGRAFYLELVMYFILSVAGYLSTFSNTPDVFLKRKNLENFTDYFIIVVRILLVLTMNSSVAVNYNIMRMSINSMIFNNVKPSFLVDASIVVFVFILSNTLNYFLVNAGTLLSFLGGMATVIICFIMPILVDIKVNEEKKSKYRKYFNYLFLVGIILISLTCTGKALYDFITDTSQNDICENI